MGVDYLETFVLATVEKTEIVNKFKYLDVIFTSGGAYNEMDKMLSGQALKGIFQLNKYLYKFTPLSSKHILELFDKLISPILNYLSEVWGLSEGKNTERIHLQLCKKL